MLDGNGTDPRGLEQFLKELEGDLAIGLMPLRVFNDADVYEAELASVFAKSWVYIGHESELPCNGDFAVRTIGEDPFIFVRGSDGVIRVLFNACRHRAATVCRVEKGNTAAFTCPFHGWSFKNTGDLAGVPARHDGYRELEFKDWGLLRAPRVEIYQGLVFAALDENIKPLEEYLGRYKWYLDMQMCLTEQGMEVLGEPHRWMVDANWKQGAENFCGDSSHTQMTHKSIMDVGLAERAAAGAPSSKSGLHVHDCDGFALSVRVRGDGTDAYFAYPPSVTRHFTGSRLDAAQSDLVRRSLVHNGTVFPNFSFLHIAVTDTETRPAAGYLSLRVWQPRGPGRTEIWNWILAPKEAPEEYKRRAYQVGMSSFGPSGSFEQDDVAVWPGVAKSANTRFAKMNSVKLNYQMGMKGMGEAEPVLDWPGPGVVVQSNAGEGGLRTFHMTWLKAMMR